MSWPPMLMHIKIRNRDNDFGIWIPIILLLIIALAVVIAFLPLIALAMIILLMVGLGRWAQYLAVVIWTAFASCWAMRGLEVNVENPREHIIVSVI